MKKAIKKGLDSSTIPGDIAGVDASKEDKNKTRVEVSRPGEGSNDPLDVVKAEKEDDAEAEEREMEEEEEEGEKSLTGSDLARSLDRLEQFAKSGDLPSRKDMLLGKASAGKLSKSERDELFNVLGGQDTVTDTDNEPAENIIKSMSENEGLQKALDVSDYLQEHHTELVKSLRRVGDEIQKSDHRRHEFNLLQAKALVDMGNMVKALSETVSVMSGQPARAPKSAGIVTKPSQVLQKSFAGRPPAGDELTKSQVMDGLDALMEDSMAKGMDGMLSSGEDIAIAVSKYEQTNMISPRVLEAVKGIMSKRQTA
jgi:hypothetical protein